MKRFLEKWDAIQRYYHESEDYRFPFSSTDRSTMVELYSIIKEVNDIIVYSQSEVDPVTPIILKMLMNLRKRLQRGNSTLISDPRPAYLNARGKGPAPVPEDDRSYYELSPEGRMAEDNLRSFLDHRFFARRYFKMPDDPTATTKRVYGAVSVFDVATFMNPLTKDLRHFDKLQKLDPNYRMVEDIGVNSGERKARVLAFVKDHMVKVIKVDEAAATATTSTSSSRSRPASTPRPSKLRKMMRGESIIAKHVAIFAYSSDEDGTFHVQVP